MNRRMPTQEYIHTCVASQLFPTLEHSDVLWILTVSYEKDIT